MIGKLKNDESGITMALAVIMIALIGAMGAGLLVFVSTDLGIVVESNQGQRAFEMADSGVKAAKKQLESEMRAKKYNDNSAMGDDVQWANSKGGVTLRDLDGDGSDRDFVRVTIENMTANSFRIVSTGEYGPAKRRIEAIFVTYDFSVPRAFFTSNRMDDSIDIAGDVKIHNTSLFSFGGVKVNGSAELLGKDEVYGYWNDNPYNSTERSTDDAGIGAVCKVSGGGTSLGDRDFDGKEEVEDIGCDLGPGGDEGNSYSGPRFVAEPSDPDNQSEDEITFPFDPSIMIGQQDEDRLEFLRQTALTQQQQDGEQHYFEYSGDETIDDWPENSTYETVVYVKFDSENLRTLDWNVGLSPPMSASSDCDDFVPGDSNNVKKGILVVEGAHLKVGQNKALFSGTVIVRGAEENSHDDTFTSNGQACWDGIVNSDGEITFRGTAGSFLSEVPLEMPALRGAELQSWREVYSAD